MKNSKLNYHVIVAALLAILAAAALIECDRQSAGRRIGATGGTFKSPCGTGEEVSQRVGQCLEAVFELIEGKFPEPKDDSSIVSSCQKFNNTERCIRGISKDCLSGIHKTAVSAVASATKRFRTAECKNEQTRSRYIEPLRCARRTGNTMASLYKNYTSMVQNIRDLPIAPEQKLTKVCCVLVSLDRDIENIFNQACPESTPAVLAIVHAMTDDARSTLCINPKCQGALNNVRVTRLKQNQNFIEPVMQILFTLSDS